MTRKNRRPLTAEEIGAQSGTELPRREALSLLFANVALPTPLTPAPLSPAAAQTDAASNAEQVAPTESG